MATKKPDIDKLCRNTVDSLTSAGIFRDDSQVVELLATKRIAELNETPGCVIHVQPADVSLLSSEEDRRWIAAEVLAERTADAADRGPE